MCESEKLKLILDLENIPIVDNFLTNEMLNKSETLYPLNVYFCKECGLVQLGYIIPAEKLFNEDYAYESGTTESRKKNHFHLAEYICKTYDIGKKSLVVDIGSNVGVLVNYFKELGMRSIGVDASANIVEKANKNGNETILGFFNSEIVDKIKKEKGEATIVTATNLFAHIQDYFSFIENLKNLLKMDGIFVFQVPHLLHLIKNLEYDTIYHEHISYFSLKPLMKFFQKYEMELFEVIETDIDGGSIRCFIGNKGKREISNNIKRILKDEEDEGIYSLDRLKKFANDVGLQKRQLRSLLNNILDEDKTIIGIGAPAKGITLLNYCKIDKDMLEYITEKAELKIGKFVPGMHIPVKNDDVLIQDKPDYALLLSWNFADEIIKNLKTKFGFKGKFIIPIPFPKITE